MSWIRRQKLPDKSAWLLAQGSLKYFTVKFLGHQWPEHYQEWDDMVNKYDRLLVQAPRGHGKSIFWSLAWPLWNVIRGKWEHLIISYSEDQVRRLIRDIRICVESNPFLEPLRPTTKEIWGTDQLSFANGSFISGLGFGTSSRGRHPNGITVDDPLKDLGGMTDEDQERAYFGVITGMAMEKTKLVTVGTPVNFGDLLEKLESNEAYARWKRPALNRNGEPLFPHLWSKAALDKRRSEMGSINFAREFLLERVDPATQPFKRVYETKYQELPARFQRIATVCDPAYSEGDGDYTAIVTVGFTGGNHAYVLEAKAIRREDPGLIVKELFRTIDAFKPDSVGIEKKKGTALEYSFREARTRGNRWDFRYVELTHGGKSKDDFSRIGGLVPRWEARSIHVHPEMALLLKQLYEFRFDDKTKGHDDLVDALAYCFHPDMSQPNTGPQNAPLDDYEASITGKPRYQIGQGEIWEPTPVYKWAAGPEHYGQRLARAMDRRIGD
jgi:hypothetical protein